MPHIMFNWVDIVFVTILIRIGYIGFKNGLLPEFFRVFGLLSAFIVSFNSYTLLSHFLFTYTNWAGAATDVVSFLLIFLAIVFAFKMLASLSSLFLSSENISGVSKLIGLVVGFGRGILLISLIYILLINSPFEYLSRSAGERSFSSQYISEVAPYVYKTGISFYPGKKVDTPLVGLISD